MRRINPISAVIVTGAVLCGCATTQTTPSECADRSPSAEAPPGESPAQEATTAAPTAAPAPSAPDLRVTCPLDIKRQIACVDAYIPMIVDTRIKLDFPSGIAEGGKDAAGRDELIAIAMQEFPNHYSVDKIPTICAQRQAMAEQMPPHMVQELTAVGSDCLAEKDCAGFSRCLAPVVEKIFAMTAKAGSR